MKRLAADAKVTGTKYGTAINCRTHYAPGHVKFQRFVDAGMKVNCYTGNGVVEIYLYCAQEDKLYVKGLLDS